MNYIEHKALRKCLATGESLDKTSLLRFVVGPDQALVPDVLGKLPGRGLWVTPTRAAVKVAIKKGIICPISKAIR